MLSRSLTVAAFAAGAFMIPAAATAPVTLKYRINQKTEQVIDLSGMGQGEQRTAIALTTFVTVGLTDSAGGYAVRAALDSIRPDSGSTPEAASAAATLKGATGTAFLGADGKLTGFKGDSAATRAAAVQGALTPLFPAIRPKVKAGDSWTDTTEVTTPSGQGSLTRRSVTTYTASAGDTRNGVKTIKVTTAGSFSVAGLIGPQTIEGTGKNSGTVFVGPNNRYMGGTTDEEFALSVTVPQAPEPIPVTGKSALVISTLP